MLCISTESGYAYCTAFLIRRDFKIWFLMFCILFEHRVTWTLKSVQSWLSICHLIAKLMLVIMKNLEIWGLKSIHVREIAKPLFITLPVIQQYTHKVRFTSSTEFRTLSIKACISFHVLYFICNFSAAICARLIKFIENFVPIFYLWIASRVSHDIRQRR